MNIKDNIRAEMDLRNMRLADLARAASIPYKTLQRQLDGAKLTANTISAVAAAFGLSEAELYDPPIIQIPENTLPKTTRIAYQVLFGSFASNNIRRVEQFFTDNAIFISPHYTNPNWPIILHQSLPTMKWRDVMKINAEHAQQISPQIEITACHRYSDNKAFVAMITKDQVGQNQTTLTRTINLFTFQKALESDGNQITSYYWFINGTHDSIVSFAPNSNGAYYSQKRD